MKTRRFDFLDVHQHPDRNALGIAAAKGAALAIRAAIAACGEARVVFACAPSQDVFLAALTAEPLDWSKVVVFHMDEYVSLLDTHPASFRSYLREHLLANIIAPRAVHFIHAEAPPAHEAARYSALLAAHPLDLACLGIGENGHLAFNDPPVADFADPALVKLVALDEACRQQQVHDGCFGSLDIVPTHALTMTIPALLNAREISCVVPGARKAVAVRDALLGPVATSCPASILRTHPRAVLHLDAASAGLVFGEGGRDERDAKDATAQ